ncbi:MAG TPA: antitoxin family protein [Gemmataceae bacterium]|nr:antitoxin family protein [Gemmataceae bacterium]
MSTITAIYENGVFRPTVPVDLPEGCTVRIVPEPTATPQEEARRRVFEALAESYDTGEPEAAARHDEHQP